MKLVSATDARKHISSIIDAVRESDDIYAIGRHNRPEVLILKFPQEYNEDLDEITNINTYSDSFSFLKDEPELYSVADLKKTYV